MRVNIKMLFFVLLIILCYNINFTAASKIECKKIIENFEVGNLSLTDWTVKNYCSIPEGLIFPRIIYNYQDSYTPYLDAHDGFYYLEIYSAQIYGNGCDTSFVYRTIYVPENAQKIVIYYDWGTDDSGYGYMRVYAKDSNIIFYDTGWLKADHSGGWKQTHNTWEWKRLEFDVTSLRGKNITLYLGIWDDGDRYSGNAAFFDDIYFTVPCVEIPKPTNHSLVISNTDWKNALSVVPIKLPVIISNNITDGVLKFIKEYEPDYIYTLGFSLNLSKSYEVSYTQVPELFFPNATEAVYAATKEHAILASQIAYMLDIPLVFEKSGYEHIINFSSVDDIQRFVLNLSEKLNYLVLTNIKSNTSLLAGRIAGMKNGYIVPVYLDAVEYSGDPDCINTRNNVSQIKTIINETIKYLHKNGFFSNSSDYIRGLPIYLAILGNEYDIPYMAVPDPGLEVINDKDGSIIYNDFLYGELTNDSLIDLAVGRFYGNPTDISLQLLKNPKNKTAALIGQYRHRKYEDLFFFHGGMLQAYNTDFILRENGFKIKRLVEKRIENITLKNIISFLRFVFGTVRRTPLSIFDVATLFTSFGTETGYMFYEFDWNKWISEKGYLELKPPEHLEVFKVDSVLNNSDIIAYFGMGDRYWIVPPEDRNETELVTDPYGRSDNLTRLEFSGFLYDDHDLSFKSKMVKQVLSYGGESFVSSGIIHDPNTAWVSDKFMKKLVMGRSIGESLTDIVNEHVSDISLYDFLKGFALLPNPCMKNVLERLVLGDPGLAFTERKDDEKDEFIIFPYGSYIAVSDITSRYRIVNKTLVVHNADDYLLEQGKPLIPVFVKEFVLPKSSKIKHIKVYTRYKKNVKLRPFIITWDEYYTSQNVSIPYPEKDYWYKIGTTLDERTIIRIYVPAVVYHKKHVKILKDARIIIDYDSPLELIVKTKPVTTGRNETIKVVIKNDLEKNVSGILYLKINESIFSRNVIIPAKSAVNEFFVYTPNHPGIYQIKAYLYSEIPIGPRVKNFVVKGKYHKRNTCIFCEKCGCDFFKQWLSRILL